MTGSHPVEPEGRREAEPLDAPLDERIAASVAPDTERNIDAGEPSETGQTMVREDDERARGEDGETFERGAGTNASKGLGAVWGDSEWAPPDEPMSRRARDNEEAAAESATAYELHETEDGERYLTDQSDESGV